VIQAFERIIKGYTKYCMCARGKSGMIAPWTNRWQGLKEMPETQFNENFSMSSVMGDVVDCSYAQDGDEVMEAILENIHATPIGRVLKRISTLPEIRKGKVLNLRRQITDGTYDVSDRLDAALDSVMEQLMS
jgi:hypothetical protein